MLGSHKILRICCVPIVEWDVSASLTQHVFGTISCKGKNPMATPHGLLIGIQNGHVVKQDCHSDHFGTLPSFGNDFCNKK